MATVLRLTVLAVVGLSTWYLVHFSSPDDGVCLYIQCVVNEP